MVSTNIPAYNNLRRTLQYLKDLIKDIKDGDEDYFSRIKKGDTVLIIDSTHFVYIHKILGVPKREECKGIGSFKNSIAKVIGEIDHDTASDHVPWDNRDLEFICKDGEKRYMDAGSEGFVFLPHPKKLKEFQKYLKHIIKNSKKVEKVLSSYYKNLN